MAESIIIHVTGDNAAKLLDRIAARFGDEVNGTRAAPLDDYLVLVYGYDDFEVEYEAPEKDEVISKLGGEPAASFCFEIRRSRSDAACDLLENFIRNDLAGLDFAVDDMYRILSRPEVERDHEFLDIYRYEKQAKRAALQ
jgi:hypothetical protein